MKKYLLLFWCVFAMSANADTKETINRFETEEKFFNGEVKVIGCFIEKEEREELINVPVTLIITNSYDYNQKAVKISYQNAGRSVLKTKETTIDEFKRFLKKFRENYQVCSLVKNKQ